jgi:hypothetical protein
LALDMSANRGRLSRPSPRAAQPAWPTVKIDLAESIV